MRRKFIVGLVAVLFAATNSFPNQADEPAVITGKWNRGSLPEKVFLFKMVNGSLSELSSSAIDSDSIFLFACKPAVNGEFYYIGTGKTSLNNRYAFFMKQGDRLNFTLNDSTYILTGKNNSPENKEMERWHNFVEQIEYRSVYFTKKQSTFVDFFPLLEEKVEALKSYPAANTKNKAFNAAFETYKKINFDGLALEYLFKPRISNPKTEDYPAFYSSLKIADVTQNADLTKFPDGMEIPERIYIVRNFVSEKPLGTQFEAIGVILDEIVNDTIKGAYLLEKAAGQRNYEGVENLENTYGKYLATDLQKSEFLKIKNGFTKPETNQPAIGFNFRDINDKPVALSDLKGKIVYIDVWATWCGPCIREIPYLKKLESDYHDKNIAFISVSIDADKDHTKWKSFVEKEQLSGIQLFAGTDGGKELAAAYKISGIPRFIVVGKDGNLVAPDAPRPSSSEIRFLFDNLLK
ncbi:MAG: TlpA family protein disulfide reductase [Dysgonamonadaceae bacterium]|nr:TlpA family protein disulfide reductase [Dysgonamonadaceae bacterium]